MSGAAKKRKTVHSSQSYEKLGLKKAYGEWAAHYTYFDDIADYGSTCEKGESDPYSVFTGIYFGSIADVNPYVVPLLFSSFTTSRDKFGKVVHISDDKAVLKGKALENVMVVEWCRSKGYGPIVIETDEGGDRDMLVFDSWVNVEDETDSFKKKREHHSKVYSLFTRAKKTFIYVPRAQLSNLLQLSDIPLDQVKPLAEKFNKVWERTAYELGEDTHDDSASLLELLKPANPAPVEDFLNSLLAAKLSLESFSRKVETFKKSPSAELANRMGFKKPYSLALYDRTSLQKVERVPIDQLEDDDKVLLTNVVIDKRWYDTVTLTTGGLYVYRCTDELGFKKNNKWQKLDGKNSEKVKHYRAMLEAISSSGKSEGGHSSDDEGEDEEPMKGLEEIEA